ncbi:MAG: hypothetical protein LBH98_03185 [Chitinispirillales bacterium]|jgi:hypothetical protein|nr:hypothetical protein [Chitinispirillales bacterium]
MTIIEIPLKYGDEEYGGEIDGIPVWNYKNEGTKYIVIPPIKPVKPDPDLIEGLEDEVEMWLIDQYREDFLNG